MTKRILGGALAPAALLWTAVGTAAAPDDKKPDFPPFSEVAKGYEKVVSTADGDGLYTVWVRKKDGQMLAELPSGYANQKHYIATTAPTGELFAGLQWGDFYVQWRRYDKRVALIEPNLSTRSTGDQESKDAIKNHNVDRVLVDVPIVCMGPSGQPVIDLDALLIGKANVFYGSLGSGLKAALARVVEAKSFPQNLEIAFEVPDRRGALKRFHYSISRIQGTPGYKPRDADDRVGFFTTIYRDLGKVRRDDVVQRKINRWFLEKADPSLQLSPPKKPITFYLEHTVPVRYRRWIKKGVLYWNQAFEKIGISDAIVVQYQDKATGAHMEKDPEDVRYNFIRWLANDYGTAIGPSRAHPETGEILDADVVLTDGWIRHFWYQYNEWLPKIGAETAMEGMHPDTLLWLEDHPNWDPRVRLTPPHLRREFLRERRLKSALGDVAYEMAGGDGVFLVRDELHPLGQRFGSATMLCMAAEGKARAMAEGGLFLGLLGNEESDGEKEPEIDGIPEWFIGPLLADLVAHEVGHTLGLRHNFKASSVYSLEQMNSPEWKGKRPMAGSVMDYLPLNVKFDEEGHLMGDVAMISVGPYDEWAIEYGYTFEDPEKVLERVAEPELAFLTDDDTIGPDPLARRYDLAADPLAWCENQMELVRASRARILDKFVDEGEPWAKARRGYDITLSTQRGTLFTMANWIGGTFVNRDHKGDPGDRKPLQPVAAEKQRAALRYVVDNGFFDEAFGLDPELLAHMTVQKWSDRRTGDPTYPVHDRIAGIQASLLTSLMNPTTLERVYDQELFLPSENDCLTLPELLETLATAVWEEVGYGQKTGATRSREAGFKKRVFTPRSPAISSLRRNLQREFLERLIDLSLEEESSTAMRAISLLARSTLQDIAESIDSYLDQDLDPYTRSHLEDSKARIQKALDASYVYGGVSGGGGPSTIILQLGEDADASQR